MAWIPGGKFTMGSNDGQPDEQPLHDVKVRGFWMDRNEVTNEQFAKFVKATNYITTAGQLETPRRTGIQSRRPRKASGGSRFLLRLSGIRKMGG
jgi:formylglycine-generating enzyme required for sulfatase activity